jgi:hypothetical protein
MFRPRVAARVLSSSDQEETIAPTPATSCREVTSTSFSAPSLGASLLSAGGWLLFSVRCRSCTHARYTSEAAHVSQPHHASRMVRMK